MLFSIEMSMVYGTVEAVAAGVVVVAVWGVVVVVVAGAVRAARVETELHERFLQDKMELLRLKSNVDP